MARHVVARGVTYEEYLVLEARSGRKLEYLRGDVLDMSLASPDTSELTPAHLRLAVNFANLLAHAIAGQPVRLLHVGLEIQVERANMAILIVDVLSPGTEAYDRGAKFGHYRQLASLQEVVFVNHASQVVEVHRRNGAGRFELYVFEANEAVALLSVGARIPVAKIYEDRNVA